MPADSGNGSNVTTRGSRPRRPSRLLGRRAHRLALLASALLLAFAASGCGGSNKTSDETLPTRPKLTVPNGSVGPAKNKQSGTTGQTGAATGNATTQTQSGADAGSGGAAPQQNTGGQGTDQNQGTATPQNTGGAAPGN